MILAMSSCFFCFFILQVEALVLITYGRAWEQIWLVWRTSISSWFHMSYSISRTRLYLGPFIGKSFCVKSLWPSSPYANFERPLIFHSKSKYYRILVLYSTALLQIPKEYLIYPNLLCLVLGQLPCLRLNSHPHWWLCNWKCFTALTFNTTCKLRGLHIPTVATEP